MALLWGDAPEWRLYSVGGIPLDKNSGIKTNEFVFYSTHLH